MRFHNRRVLITGGGSGIGLALAEGLVAEGARVLICGRRRQKLEAAAARLPGLHWVEADITTEKGRRAVDETVIRTFTALDLLVNNAGVQFELDLGHGGDRFEDKVAEEVAINLTAPILLTNGLLPRLLQGNNPAVVNITSVLAHHPRPTTPVYSAAKAGFRSYTRSLRRQLAIHGVRVVEVLPPLVDTAIAAGRGHRKISPQAVAAGIIIGIADGREEIWLGKARVARLLNRLSPGLLARMLART
jgi:short-subunit dehydrogenase involved in D-alanine esterification of teichoic acids